MLSRGRTRWGLALALGAFVGAPIASATPFSNAPATVVLMPGVVARRNPRPCGNWIVYGPGCTYWQLDGAVAPSTILDRANMFAAARGGRIVAAMPDGVVFTDDRGTTWRAARWDSSSAPLSITFDPRSDFGVAVGTNGGVWVSEDRGETWRTRRDDPGQRLIDVALVDRTLAFLDDRGGAWVSTDGGISVRTLIDPATVGSGAQPAVLSVTANTITISGAGTLTWRVDGRGNIERVTQR